MAATHGDSRHDGQGERRTTVAMATVATVANTRKGATAMAGKNMAGRVARVARVARFGMAALVALALLIPFGADTVGAAAPSKPGFCATGSASQKALTFRWVALFVDSTKPDYTQVWNNRNGYSHPYNPSLRPGDSFYVLAFVTDCTDGANENANSHALFEYRSTTSGTQRHDGPSPSFTRVAGNQYEGLYVAKVTLYGYNPCDCDRIGLKELYMGDRAGGHTFTVNQYGWMGNTWGAYRR